MDATNDTPKRPSKARRKLNQLRLKKQLARERIELARMERAASLEELRAKHIVPQRNPASDVMLEMLRRKSTDQVSLLEECKRTGKQLSEGNFLWDWVSGYQDLIDRLRSPDGLLLSAISVAGDRQYGSYWPFFRTWNDLALLRGAARIAYQTVGVAQGGINSVASYVIGEGFVYRCAVKKGEDAPGLALACQDVLDQNSDRNCWPRREFACPVRDSRDGEWYQRSFGRDDGLTDWRWIEPEQLIQPASSTLQEWSYGKKNPTDPYDVETVLAYHASYDGNNTHGDPVPASEVIGHTWNVDSTVKRGIPDLAYDTYDFLKTVSRLIDNMATGAAVQASFAYIRQWDSPVTADTASDFVSADADYTQTNAWTGSPEGVRRHKAGGVEDIPKGQTFLEGPSSPGGPNWVAISQSVLSAVAIKWSAPKWLLSNDTDLNYASSLTAESPFVKRCQHVQGVHYKPLFLRAKWRELYNWCQAHGGITASGKRYSWQDVKRLIDIQCEPPSVEVRDKDKEAQGNATRVQAGWKSRQTVAQEEGLDWEQEKANIELYNEEMGGAMGALPMPGDDEGGQGGNPFEHVILESGFTGTVTDKRGRKIHYVNGKRTKTTGKPTGNGKQAAGNATQAAHQQLTAKVQEKLGGDIKEMQATPEGKETIKKSAGLAEKVKAKLAAGVQAAVAAADEELGGGLSIIASGAKSGDKKAILQGAARALNSVFVCVHEEVFEAAMSQHSMPGAHAVGMIGAKVAAVAESSMLKGVAWAWAKVRGVGEGVLLEGKELTDADKQLIAHLAEVAADAVRDVLAAAGVEDAEIDQAAAEKRIAELLGA